jgi:hypothetical protein
LPIVAAGAFTAAGLAARAGGCARLETGTPVWRTSVNTALILIPVLVLAAGFVVFCEVDLARAEQVRYLPKWGWAILCMGIGLTIPFGGIAYLVFGKVRRPRLG